MDEDNDWQINTDELESLLLEAKSHCTPKVFVLTNPGNPTGALSTQAAQISIRNIIGLPVFVYTCSPTMNLEYFCLSDQIQHLQTGSVLPRKNIEDVIKFCHRNKLVLFADEVYQDNIYTEELPFYSCRRVMFEMGPDYTDLKLISLHCSAKGCFGE